MQEIIKIPVSEVKFVKELYPRLKENETAIEQYKDAIEKLPPIIIARDGVLIDGYHRWTAHKRLNIDEISAINLGNLTDIEILKESLVRNSYHGYQLSAQDKKNNANRLYVLLSGNTDEKYEEISNLLSISKETTRKYCQESRQNEKKKQQERALDLWLNCWTQEKIAEELNIPQQTISGWITENEKNSKIGKAPGATPDKPWGNIQHFDLWNFNAAHNDTSYFGKMPSQIVENLLWLYTEPGQIVFDPFAGSGTTIDTAKEMGRRVWSSDRKPASNILPIHNHDITSGYPENAPGKVDFILLDPPYWKQAEGKYSNDAEDLGNMELGEFYKSWSKILNGCIDHLSGNGHLAFIVSPNEDKDNDKVIDLAFEMYAIAVQAGFTPMRRIIVSYNTQQATGQQVEWARKKKKLLKLYRDLIVFQKK